MSEERRKYDEKNNLMGEYLFKDTDLHSVDYTLHLQFC